MATRFCKGIVASHEMRAAYTDSSCASAETHRGLALVDAVYLTNYVPIHSLTMFQALTRHFRSLQFFIAQRMESGRPWSVTWGELAVRVQKCLSVPRFARKDESGWDPPQVHFPISTYGDLKKARPAIIISHELGFRTLMALWYRQRHPKCRIIAHVRVTMERESTRSPLRRILRKYLLARVDHVVTNGHNGEAYLKAIGCPEGKLSVVTCGTDLLHFGKKTAHIGSAEQLRVLYVGQINHVKNVGPFVACLQRMAERHEREVALTVAGWGPLLGDLQKLAAKGVVTTTYLDTIPYEKLADVYSQADVFVMPSLGDEWGMVVNEAMASGLPVLGSTRCQAASELIVDGENGWLYDPMDSAATEDAITRMLSTDSTSLARMGERAAQTAREHSAEREAQEIAAVVQKVLREDSP